MSELFYIFGIRKNEITADLISYGDLTVVHEMVSESEFGQEAIAENLKNMEWVNRKVIHHQTRLSEIAKDETIIPLKFGTIFKSEESIQKMLAGRAEEFTNLLKQFKGKQEWGVKLFYAESVLSQWVEKHEEELQEIDKQIQSVNPGGAFLLKKKKEEALKKHIKDQLNLDRKRVFEYLSQLGAQTVVNKEIEQKLTGRKEKNLLNLALLIDPDQLQKVKKFLDLELKKMKDKGVFPELSGPWPPYSFVTNG